MIGIIPAPKPFSAALIQQMLPGKLPGMQRIPEKFHLTGELPGIKKANHGFRLRPPVLFTNPMVVVALPFVSKTAISIQAFPGGAGQGNGDGTVATDPVLVANNFSTLI